MAIERSGVLETRLVELRGRDPTIELPVKAEWGPNVYVSVLAVRGRVREVPWYSMFSWGWRSPADWWRATAQMQIIGKRHYGKKAAPAGGGGGQFPTRELFDTLLLWNPQVLVDARGEALVKVPLNDSLSPCRSTSGSSNGRCPPRRPARATA